MLIIQWLQVLLPVPRVLVYFSAGVFSLALALAVEFTQLFFPPRTVSLNDILAESAGAVIGLSLCATSCYLHS